LALVLDGVVERAYDWSASPGAGGVLEVRGVDLPGGSGLSLDELVALNVAALDDTSLKATLVDAERARGRVEAFAAAAAAELDRRGCFVVDGAVSAASWLAHHTGAGRRVAAGRVRLAKRLGQMPVMAAALAAGSVTEGHAKALGRCLTPRTAEAFQRDEQMLVGIAQGLEADDFDRAVTRWLSLNDSDGPEPVGGGPVSEAHLSTLLSGRMRLDADLDLEDGIEVRAELDALADELYREDHHTPDIDPAARRTRAQRYGAALVEMARRSSATRRQDAHDDARQAAGQPVPTRSRPRRPQLLVITPLAALAAEPGARAELDDGTLIPASVLERWACDCSVGRVVMNGASQPIDLGKLTYTPSDPQRRGLVARDKHCFVPGCKRKARWCEGHHVIPWPNGPTNLTNLVLVCNRHHKLIHAGILQLHANPHTPGAPWTVHRADGTPLHARPPPPALAA